MSWGKTEAQRATETAANADTFYLLSFRDPETRVRIVVDDPINNWVGSLWHFDRFSTAPGNSKPGMSYPCGQDNGLAFCPGCEFPFPDNHDPEKEFGEEKNGRRKRNRNGCGCYGCQVRSKSYGYILPVLNERDFLALYKIGSELRDDLIAEYNLRGTLTTFDYAILRDDSSGRTKYSAKVLPGTEGERRMRTRIPDLGRLLRKKYLEALQTYNLDPASVGFDPASADVHALPVDDEPPAEPVAGQAPAVNEDGDSEDSGPAETTPPIGLLSEDEMRAALAGLNVTVPPGFPRPQLEQMYAAMVPAMVPAMSAPASTPAPTAAPQAQQPAAQAAPVFTPPAFNPPQAAATNGNGNGAAAPAAPAAAAGEVIDFKSWTTPDIRDFLSEAPAVEYSPTAARSVLISLAEKKDEARRKAGVS